MIRLRRSLGEGARNDARLPFQMPDQQHGVIDLTMAEIDAVAREIVDVMGRKWIGPERGRVKAERRRAIEDDPHAYRYHPPTHPLIEWTLEYDRWREIASRAPKHWSRTSCES